MYTIIGTIGTLLIISAFLFSNRVIRWRANIAFSALVGASFFLTAGGFLISQPVGFFALAAVLLMIALLFGYESRG